MSTSIAPRRIAAFCLDWLVIAVWGGIVFAAVIAFDSDGFSAPADPWTAQLLGLLVMTLPVVLYFSVTESSTMKGSPGKWVLGLEVETGSGRRLGLAAALIRNLVKLSPWEFGHMLAYQAVFSGESGLPVWTLVPAVIAFGGPIVWLVELFRMGRTPYDRISAAHVRLRRI